MRRIARLGLIAMALVVPAGCHNADEARASKLAQDALGIKSTKETTTGHQRRKVVVEETVRVLDAESGQVLSETTKKTPVEVDTEVKQDVAVSVGKTVGDAPAK